MNNQPTQKKLTFNGKNLVTLFILLTVLNVVGLMSGIDPKTDAGSMFYMFGAIITAFMFPTFEVKDVESKNKETDS